MVRDYRLGKDATIPDKVRKKNRRRERERERVMIVIIN